MNDTNIPAGWALVPLEMHSDQLHDFHFFAKKFGVEEGDAFALAIYGALLACAPTPPVDAAPCAGKNCGTTIFDHSPECLAEHEAAINSGGIPSHCMCAACCDGVIHASDCSVHNMPAMPNGPCDCGAARPPVDAVPGGLDETQQRKLFETRARKSGYSLLRDGDEYRHPPTQHAWQGWMMGAEVATPMASRAVREPVGVVMNRVGSDGITRKVATLYESGKLLPLGTRLYPDPAAPQAATEPIVRGDGCREQCWACAESGIGCNPVNDANSTHPAAAYPLPDSLYPGSRDWLAGDYAARVEWLHSMYECAKRERDELLDKSIVATDATFAWATHHDEPMLFLDLEEALLYCNDDEVPIPLIRGDSRE